jgi:hypothetical protein
VRPQGAKVMFLVVVGDVGLGPLLDDVRYLFLILALVLVVLSRCCCCCGCRVLLCVSE